MVSRIVFAGADFSFCLSFLPVRDKPELLVHALILTRRAAVLVGLRSELLEAGDRRSISFLTAAVMAGVTGKSACFSFGGSSCRARGKPSASVCVNSAH